ncbi:MULTISPECIES: aldehyde dehydrogenase family protein [Streptomyces]|uniref:aldehyde dehydrogenase (NAD(+)) n=2 Tax=Streptomyces TaxID=1883 RepID=A0A3M8FDX1_9ACTN|nr:MULTISPECIES: aldehyde dehydrogenase family protein [Streptomyces]KNE80307.1 aldehyde dehydrogenase [Streptomyces fradiae]OFA42594.1 aldehyde dehydrogenase [Streptomyces fradiae]PQM24906.1 aldehyde dehydrogenase family protein [Streptomyces xinghaiensis]RKM98957.1 aldehyde dehydrogenase family protein [Streptomyces xinghaiensis]RNC76141.1 aldehyde dehydrogenase family protein [Streptomyces xinghaiensis]
MTSYTKHFIGGEWTPSGSTETIDVVNPADEQVIGSIPAGTAEDVDRAVRAAAQAFETWSQTSPSVRAAHLLRIQQVLEARGEEIARLVASEVGTPVQESRVLQAGLPAFTFGHAADLASGFDYGPEEVGNSHIVREPVGVVGCITPWNFPLHQVSLKVALALAAGCTVVLKPSEVAPLSALLLAEIAEETGLPAGVLNVVTGYGPVVGEALVAHPEVSMVSFTGSTRAGRRVAALAADTVKKVALELGGKSPNIILDDADLRAAVTDGVAKCYLNSGQTCIALTRMLVPRDKLEEAGRIAAEVASGYHVGDPQAEETQIGPMANDAQLKRVRDYIAAGIAEGATLLTGGPDAPQDGPGYFVAPTVFSDVSNDMTIAREEIFGPVLSLIPYDTEEEAVAIANDTPYGLAGGVWSGDPGRAKSVARRIRAGMVDVNGGAFNPLAPFGGYKQSGVGREAGRMGFEEFLETKAIQL